VAACPENGARSKQMDVLTVKSLVRRLPLGMPDTQYYFCEAQDCDVVYFALEPQALIFRRGDLLVRVGAKLRTQSLFAIALASPGKIFRTSLLKRAARRLWRRLRGK
jgi:hypothetical protein